MRLDLEGVRNLSYQISQTFARITNAAGSLVLSGTSLILNSLSGSQLSSVDLSGTLDPRYAGSMSIDGHTLGLYSASGAVLSRVSLPQTDISGKVDRSDAISSVTIGQNGNTITISFWDADGNYQDQVSFTIGT